MKIAIINGPNLNLTGSREPDVYGTETFTDLAGEMERLYPGSEFAWFQSNHEGELVDYIQRLGEDTMALILNPGALAHYGYSLADAVNNLRIPVVEVHLSMVYRREPWRHTLVVAPYCRALITGMGMQGYRYAMEWLHHQINMQA